MSRLSAALALADLGLRIFPLRPNSKTPLLEAGWKAIATTDEIDIITWLHNTDNNYAVAGGSGLIVIDIDEKDGKNGWNEFCEMGGSETFMVQTPTGGYHAYYATGEDFTQRKLSPGIDVRSAGGYVVGPGSRIDGYGTGAYSIVHREASSPGSIAPLPQALRARLAALRVRETAAAASELDTKLAIHFATETLKSFEPAIEGAGGNETTYRAISEARDRGVSEEVCLELAEAHYNPRCQPPWSYEELAQLVRNAYAYAQRPIGSRAVGERMRGVLDAVTAVGPPVPRNPAAPAPSASETFVWGLDEIDINWRADWIFEGFLERKQVTLLAAAGGTGKSALAIALAAKAAAGQNFVGFEYDADRPANALVFNAEDNQYRQAQRLWAAAHRFGIPYEDLKQRVLIGHATKTVKRSWLLLNDMGALTPNKALVDFYKQTIAENSIDLLCLDTFSSLHQGEENRNDQMAVLVDLLAEIADETNVAVLVNHHTGKHNGMLPGDTSAVRGASAITNGVRYVFTLCPPTEDDERLFRGEDPKHLRRRARLDAAKQNHGEMSGEAVWLYRHSIMLPVLNRRGERLTAVCVDAPDHKVETLTQAKLKDIIAGLVYRLLQDNHASALKLSVLVNGIAEAPSLADKSKPELRDLLHRTFCVPRDVEGVVLKLGDIQGSDAVIVA